MEYDVAFSYAGENRDYVRKVADCLKKQNVKVFYDEYEQVNLWGKNLYDHLSEVYGEKASYTVMFISSHYAQKLWTNHERQSAQARAFSEKKEYILPVRFDKTEIPGLPKTIGYISLENKTPEDLCRMICQKLGLKMDKVAAEHSASREDADELEIFLSNCNSLELTSSLLSNKWSLEQLNTLLSKSPSKGANILRSIAARNHRDTDTWLRLLGSYICAKTRDLSEVILEISFGSKYSWSARTAAATWLRFYPQGMRETIAEKDKTYEDEDIDNIRLVIACLGFCGDLSGLSWLQQKHHVMTSEYYNEKFGPYLILAYLDCHAVHGRDWFPSDPLRYLTEVMRETEKRSNMYLGFFDFHQRLQTIDRGLLIKLIQHLYKEKHEIMLQAALAILETRPTPALMQTLISIASNSGQWQLSRSALRAIAFTSSSEIEKLLLEFQNKDIAGARDAFILWIGLNKRIDYINYLTDNLGRKDSSNTEDYILWSIGELAASEPELASTYLLNYAGDYDVSPTARATAWLGLGKTKKIKSKEEIALAIESATEPNATLILSFAACIAGYPEFLEKGIHASQIHSTPVWMLQSHLYRDFTNILMEKAGQGGIELKNLLDMGDLD